MTMPETLEPIVAELVVDGADEAAAWRVLRFDYREALSEVTAATVVAVSLGPVDPASLLGKRAYVQLPVTGAGAWRRFHGVVSQAAVTHASFDRCVVELALAHPLWPLGLGEDHRIFQDLEPAAIVRRVLRGAGLDDALFVWDLRAADEPLPYVTQRGESDLAFIARLLAAEGIAFALVHDDAPRVLFFDDNAATQPVAVDDVLPWRATAELGARRLIHASEARAAASDAAMLRDYAHDRASYDLSQRRAADRATGREVYVHPGRFQDDPRGRRLTRRTLEGLQRRAHTIVGGSDAPTLSAGRRVTLDGHPRASINAELLLVAVQHTYRAGDGAEGAAARYENRFEAIPQARAFRPDARPAAPDHRGVEVATVAGDAGEELHGDARGRVKVRFPWDRSGVTDATSSTWLRVGQIPMPGPMIIPRVGFEVIVGHELGDFDRPVVTGHLYNGAAPPPYGLPAGATVSTLQTATTAGGPGANELRFEDAAGAEEMYAHASRDFTCSVEHDASTRVAVDERCHTGGNRTCRVGANATERVTGSRTLAVGGNLSVSVEGNANEGVQGATAVTVASRSEKVGGDLAETVQGSLKRTVGGLQSVLGIGGIQRDIQGSSSTSVGGAWIDTSAASVATQCKQRLETVGALKLIRTKTFSASAGAAHALTCASLSVKCGGNRVDSADGPLVLTASGGLSAKAANITISGKTRVVFKVGGTTIEVKPSKVTIKSSTVDLTNADVISSKSSHRQNS
jgi:type VI secretion system secreted protein VgrG